VNLDLQGSVVVDCPRELDHLVLNVRVILAVYRSIIIKHKVTVLLEKADHFNNITNEIPLHVRMVLTKENTRY